MRFCNSGISLVSTFTIFGIRHFCKFTPKPEVGAKGEQPEAETLAVPLNKTHFIVVRGLICSEVPPQCVNEESSTERCSYNRQVNRSPQQ